MLLDEVFASTVKLVVTVESHPFRADNTSVYVPLVLYVFEPTVMLCPLQILCEFELTIALGSVILTESVYTHVLSSVIVTLYIPTAKLDREVVVSPPFQAIVYGALTLDILRVAVPSFNPLHKILVDCKLADRLEIKLTSGKFVTIGAFKSK